MNRVCRDSKDLKLIIALDLAGISVSNGSACISGSLKPFRVRLNMEIPKKTTNSSIRFSLSRFTNLQQIDDCVNIVVDLVKKLRH